MKKIISYPLIAALLLTNSLIIAAQPLTPERYIRLEMAARQAALEGAKARLDQLESANASTTNDDLSAQTHQAISHIYREAGVSPSAALAWENRNREAIEAWLQQHPDIHHQYQDLTEDLNALSALIDAIQKR